MTLAPLESAQLASLPPEELFPELERTLAALEAKMDRQRFVDDPIYWAAKKLNVNLWSGQARIVESVRDNRRTAAMTCHEVGKSFDAALVAAWWLDTHEAGEAFVVTTAPTAPQVQVILWREIGRMHARGLLSGRVNQTEWYMDVRQASGKVKEEQVAIGRKPSDYDPTAFQGIHAPFVLVIIDESCGVRGPIREAIDSLIANDNSKLLEIGNPDDPLTEFNEICKPGSGYNVVQIGAFDSPNFTGEELPEAIKRQLIGKTYVEEKRAKWAPSWSWVNAKGERIEPKVKGREAPLEGVVVRPPDGVDSTQTNPFWQSKVLGLFPPQSSTGSLIPLVWIRAAQERTLPTTGVNGLGLDVGASEDGDPSCLGQRCGSVFRILYEEREPDTMKTTGRMLKMLTETGAEYVNVDYIGVGRGVVDRSKEQNRPVYPISVGEAGLKTACLACKHEWLAPGPKENCPKCKSDATQKEFANLLSELWWSVRERFERGDIDIDPLDDDLAAELVTLQWAPNSKGQTQVSYADGPSPNRADALMLTFAPKPTLLPSKKFNAAISW